MTAAIVSFDIADGVVPRGEWQEVLGYRPRLRLQAIYLLSAKYCHPVKRGSRRA